MFRRDLKTKVWIRSKNYRNVFFPWWIYWVQQHHWSNSYQNIRRNGGRKNKQRTRNHERKLIQLWRRNQRNSSKTNISLKCRELAKRGRRSNENLFNEQRTWSFIGYKINSKERLDMKMGRLNCFAWKWNWVDS